MKKITVFCGSSYGADAIYTNQAALLGKTLAQRNIELIYGGAKIGLMGTVADAVLQYGGKVTGVLPYFLSGKEVAHDGLTDLILVDTMHERKAIMHERSDGIIALPGGFGTMEELFEMLTWAQLNLHNKPIGILNCNGYYRGLLELIQHMADQGFLKPEHQKMLLSSDNIDKLLTLMNAYISPPGKSWITEDDM